MRDLFVIPIVHFGLTCNVQVTLLWLIYEVKYVLCTLVKIFSGIQNIIEHRYNGTPVAYIQCLSCSHRFHADETCCIPNIHLICFV